MCSVRQTVAPLVQELVVDGEEDDKTYLFKKKISFPFRALKSKAWWVKLNRARLKKQKEKKRNDHNANW